MRRLLIIDDDQVLNELLSDFLTPFNFTVTCATRPDEGLELLRAAPPALVILDVMLPGRNGFELCQEIRRQSQVPIIMLTARGELHDRMTGFEMGADDYVPKPFEPRELALRIQSILRRTEKPLGTRRVLISSLLTLDLHHERALLGNETLDLTHTEFEILKFLMQNPSSTVTRDQIMDHLRGTKCESFDRTVDVVVGRLRKKLGDSPRQPKYLKTSWGSGYRFIGAVEEVAQP